jgi:5-bromo-4-chloroindolyl phosphate hydrolysis protein
MKKSSNKRKLTKEEKQLIRPELDNIRQKLIILRKKSKKA